MICLVPSYHNHAMISFTQLYTACGCADEQLLAHVEEMLEELGDVPAASNEDDQDICSSNDEMDTNLN